MRKLMAAGTILTSAVSDPKYDEMLTRKRESCLRELTRIEAYHRDLIVHRAKLNERVRAACESILLLLPAARELVEKRYFPLFPPRDLTLIRAWDHEVKSAVSEQGIRHIRRMAEMQGRAVKTNSKRCRLEPYRCEIERRVQDKMRKHVHRSRACEEVAEFITQHRDRFGLGAGWSVKGKTIERFLAARQN